MTIFNWIHGREYIVSGRQKLKWVVAARLEVKYNIKTTIDNQNPNFGIFFGTFPDEESGWDTYHALRTTFKIAIPTHDFK